MRNWTSYFDSRALLLVLGLNLGLLSLIPVFHSNFESHQKTTTLEEGTRTCFPRLGQSFTAYVIGESKSEYLAKDFMNMTEECFGELLSRSQELFEEDPEGRAILNEANKLATDVHWFHERILADEKGTGLTNTAGNGKSQNLIQKKFTTLEVASENLLGLLSGVKENHSRILRRLQIIQLAGLLTGLVFLFFSFLRERQRKWSNQLLELDALKELEVEGPISVVRAESLIGQALSFNGLESLKKLYLHCQHTILHGQQGILTQSLREVVNPENHLEHQKGNNFNIPDPTKVKEGSAAIEFINEDSHMIMAQNLASVESFSSEAEEASIVEEQCNVDETISQVIDLLSDRIFSNGILIDLQSEEDVFVNAESEALVQVLYNLLLQSINSMAPLGNETVEGKKILKVELKRLGGAVLMDVTDTGVGYDQEWIKAINHSHGVSLNISNTELVICHELVKEFGAELVLSNLYDENNRIHGAQTRVIFRGTKPKKISRTLPGKELKSLIKGKKRDLIKNLSKRASRPEISN